MTCNHTADSCYSAGTQAVSQKGRCVKATRKESFVSAALVGVWRHGAPHTNSHNFECPMKYRNSNRSRAIKRRFKTQPVAELQAPERR